MKLWTKIKSTFKADWKNHLIGFLGTIIGILIAFQLQDWQDKRNEESRLRSAVEALKFELYGNLQVLKFGIESYGSLKDLTDIIIKYNNSDSTLLLPIKEWPSIKSKHPDSFQDEFIVSKTTTHIITKYIIPINFFPPKLYSDNWEVVKSSGLLHLVPHERLSTLMRIYGELSRDYSGISPDEFLIYVRGHKFKNLTEITKLNELTNNLNFEYDIKLQRLNEVYPEIEKY